MVRLGEFLTEDPPLKATLAEHLPGGFSCAADLQPSICRSQGTITMVFVMDLMAYPLLVSSPRSTCSEYAKQRHHDGIIRISVVYNWLGAVDRLRCNLVWASSCTFLWRQYRPDVSTSASLAAPPSVTARVFWASLTLWRLLTCRIVDRVDRGRSGT